MGRKLEVTETNSGQVSEERGGRLVALGRALSDPIRVWMLGMMVEGRSCCELPNRGAPAGSDEDPGICVCEFEDYFGMGQSKVSYHIRKLKEAGLVRRRSGASGASIPSTGSPPVSYSGGRGSPRLQKRNLTGV